MRLGLIIVMLTAIGVSLVHVRARQARAESEWHRLRLETAGLTRQIVEKQVELANKTKPEEIYRRGQQMNLIPKDAPQGAEGPVANGSGNTHRR